MTRWYVIFTFFPMLFLSFFLSLKMGVWGICNRVCDAKGCDFGDESGVGVKLLDALKNLYLLVFAK